MGPKPNLAELLEQVENLRNAMRMSNEEIEELEAQNQALEREKEGLRVRNEALEGALRNAMQRREPPTDPIPEIPPTAGGYILVTIPIMLADLVFYEKVPIVGGDISVPEFLVHLIAATGVGMLLFEWAKKEWERFECLMIPNALIVILTLLSGLNAVSGGFIFNGAVVFRPTPPEDVIVSVVVGLCAATTRFWVWLFDRATIFMNDPITPIRRRWWVFTDWLERGNEETGDKKT